MAGCRKAEVTGSAKFQGREGALRRPHNELARSLQDFSRGSARYCAGGDIAARCPYHVARLVGLFVGLFLLSGVSSLRANDSEALLTRWLEAQKDIKTWSADFVQTRTLKTFSQPLKSEGQVWFTAPNQFRWELGQQTIAIRRADEMLILYPRLKRAEKYPLSGNLPSQWKDALGLLEAGFPRDRQDLDARFNIESVQVKDSLCEVSLQPKSTQARRMMPRIGIVFSPEDSSLRATELHFADGSIMRNDFSNPRLNGPIDEKLFAPEIPSDFKLVEPLQPKK